MSDLSPLLALPLLQPAQAQKHVTHNEALRLLDVLVQPAVTSRSTMVPPDFPAPGQRFILPAGATGAWAGQDGALSFYDQEAWVFLAPAPGWQAHVLDEGSTAVWTGSGWVTAAEAPAEFLRLGIGTSADATNRLAVAADATLLTHAGTGHQLKINISAATDTASLLFQTGWSGRAEMGTAGSEDFAIKTSADGSAWVTALQLEAGTGLASGAAVQGTATDTTAGRLLKTGAFGLGGGLRGGRGISFDGTDRTPAAIMTHVGGAGFYWLMNTAGAGESVAFPAGFPQSHGVIEGYANSYNTYGYSWQRLSGTSGNRQWMRRATSATTWTAWQEVYHQGNITGTVSQSGGVPTGAIIERSSNANGTWLRWADGTQICHHMAASTTATTNAWGSMFISALQNFTFPTAFADIPTVTPATRHVPGESISVALAFGQAVTATTASIYAASGVSSGGTRLGYSATGRWY